MSQIEELLKGEKVEWKKLGEVCEICTGKLNANAKVENGSYPFFTCDEKISKIDNYDFDTTAILLSGNGSRIGHVNLYSGKFNAYQRTYVIEILNKNLNIEFLYYYFKAYVREYIDINKKGSFSIPYITLPILENFEIPIPSLETQEKIVKILDKFTKYVTELQAELQARIKQYDYYRDMMLSEDYLNKLSEKIDNIENYVEYIFLENIIKIKNGKDWKNLEVGDIPVYGSGGEMGVFVNKYSYNKPTVLIPRKGSIENVFYLDKPFWNVDTIFYTEINEDKIIPKYFYYFIQNYDLTKFSTNSTRPSLTKSSLNKLLIPVPPLKIQSQVVKILDKFQELINETKGLLPEEIEQRQKQYEFYREKLLTFDVKYATTGNGQRATGNGQRAIIPINYYNLLKQVVKIVGISLNFGVEWKSLGEIAEYYDGVHKTPKYIEKGIPFVSVQDIRNIYDNKKYISLEDFEKYKIKPRKDDIFMTRIGDIGTCAIVKDDDKLAYYVTLALIRPNQEIILSKFLKYLIESNQGKKELSKRILHNATPIKINLSEIGKLRFSIPSLAVQQHIINILDKFDALINDISQGLPKEIELRQKQYEYFREKLLSFEN